MCCRCRLWGTNPSTTNSYSTSNSYTYSNLSTNSHPNSYTRSFLHCEPYPRYGNGSNWFSDHFNRQCNGRQRNRYPG